MAKYFASQPPFCRRRGFRALSPGYRMRSAVRLRPRGRSNESVSFESNEKGKTMVAVVSPTETRLGFRALAALLSLATLVHAQTTRAADGSSAGPRLVDLSLLIASRISLHLANLPAISNQPLPAYRPLEPVSQRHRGDRRQHGHSTRRATTFRSLRPRRLCPTRALRPNLYRPDSRVAIWRRGMCHRLPRPA